MGQVFDSFFFRELGLRLFSLMFQQISLVTIVHHQKKIQRILHDIVQVDDIGMVDFRHYINFRSQLFNMGFPRNLDLQLFGKILYLLLVDTFNCIEFFRVFALVGFVHNSIGPLTHFVDNGVHIQFFLLFDPISVDWSGPWELLQSQFAKANKLYIET